ncbi:MAG TPA: DUF3090 family protein [Actinomycetota bacterium]|nr:DUF3090 family protein [Actinomycetota bacterium]
MQFDVTPDVFTADFTGQPGDRTFYLQARGSSGVHSFLLEKQQVAILAEKLQEMLLMIDEEDTIKSAAPQRDPALVLEEPVDAEWRIGTIGLLYDEGRDLVVIALQEAGADEEEDDDADDSGYRFFLRKDQVRALILHALAAVGEGRPLCQLCGLPMDPGGHVCPASNGHRPGG